MKIATIALECFCASLLVAVATRPLWLHIAWTVARRRSRKRHGGML